MWLTQSKKGTASSAGALSTDSACSVTLSARTRGRLSSGGRQSKNVKSRPHCAYCKANDPTLLGNCTFCNATLHVECYADNNGFCPSCRRGDGPPEPNYALLTFVAIVTIACALLGFLFLFAFLVSISVL